MDKIERFLAYIAIISQWGHSATISISIDGDGEDKLRVTGIDLEKHKEEANALSNHGCDIEHISNGSAWCKYEDRIKSSKKVWDKNRYK